MTDCIEWTGSITSCGYGYLYMRMPGESKWKQHRAHRLALWMATGVQPVGFVLHRCHNRKCVNPDHLYEGTHEQNMKDRAASGRNRSGRDRLTPELVKSIRELCSRMKQRDVAKRLDLPKSTVGDVMSGKCWKDLK